VQVERAGQTLTDQRRGARLAHFDLFAELPGQDAATFHRQISPACWLRHRTDKNVVLDGGIVELPGRDPGSARRDGEAVHCRRRPADRQVMEPPVRSILRHGGGDGRGRPAAPRLPSGDGFIRVRIRRRHDRRGRQVPREA
jgi:hypothetical protein